jgi:two-component system, NarL family, response regulator NreC
MSAKQKIMIADDHRLLRESLRVLLSSDPELEVVGEAEDGQQAIRVAEKFKPGIVLMDLTMPRMNGFDAIKEIKKRSFKTKILVLTEHKTDEYILAAFQAGADGYILKECSNDELRMGIKNVLSGKFFISPGISRKVIEGYLQNRGLLKPSTSWDALTPREKGILKLIAEGYKNMEIAEFLCISVKTVEKHRANLMRKLDRHSIPLLTALAIEKGLISE